MDSDLTQYNATPVFVATADVDTNAEPFLVPTGGKLITSENNGANQAPVNRSIKRLKNLFSGLRGATIGDFAGAVRKTFYGIYADGVGGVTNTYGPGIISAANELWAETGDITAFAGNILALVGSATIRSHITSEIGNIVATAGRLQAVAGNVFAGNIGTPAYGVLAKNFLAFVGTAATGANPARGTSIKNQLVAKNIVKHWGRVTSAAGAITGQVGSGAWSASIVDLGAGLLPRYVIRITMDDPMDDANYHVEPLWYSANNDQKQAGVLASTMTTTTFDLFGMLASGGTYIDLTVNPFNGGFSVLGQQTT